MKIGEPGDSTSAFAISTTAQAKRKAARLLEALPSGGSAAPKQASAAATTPAPPSAFRSYAALFAALGLPCCLPSGADLLPAVDEAAGSDTQDKARALEKEFAEWTRSTPD